MIKNSGMTFWATLKDEDKAKKFRKKITKHLDDLFDDFDYEDYIEVDRSRSARVIKVSINVKKFIKNYSEEELHDIVDYLYKVFTEANKTKTEEQE